MYQSTSMLLDSRYSAYLSELLWMHLDHRHGITVSIATNGQHSPVPNTKIKAIIVTTTITN